MFTALFDEAMYTRLQELRSGIEDPAEVFVPVGAEVSQGSAAKVRLLFIGKATRDFTEDSLVTFAGARDRAIELLKAMPRSPSPFFQFARDTTREVLLGMGLDASDSLLASHCGWSNLAKIGARTGNSSSQSLARQAPLCISALQAEITAFKPSGIILTNTNFAEHEILRPVFGEGWHQSRTAMDGVAWKLDESNGVPVVWTNHPQGMQPAGSRAEAKSLAVKLIVAAMQGKPLPPGVAFSP